MTACAVFEDGLIDYDELPRERRLEVDEHVNGCVSCREYLEMLRTIDRTLTTQIRSVHLDPRRVADIKQWWRAEPIAPVSRVPEWLDFVAAAAVLAFGSGLAWKAGLFVAVLNALSVSP